MFHELLMSYDILIEYYKKKKCRDEMFTTILMYNNIIIMNLENR